MPATTRTVETDLGPVLVTEPTLKVLWELIHGGDASLNVMDVLTGRSALPERVLRACTSLGPEQVPQLTPSEARRILDAVREVLADFLPLMKDLHFVAEVARQLSATGGTPGTSPEASSASSAS